VSNTTNRLPLAAAEHIAVGVMLQLEPDCEVISLAGSLRRQRPTIGDIEIVCVPKAYDASPLFCSGIARVVNQWPKVKGELPCRYTQRILSEGIRLDLFMVHLDGYGLQRAIRTGSADWCRTVLAPAWVRAGYHSEGGLLRRADGSLVPCRTEPELFTLIGLRWVDPQDREVPHASAPDHRQHPAARRSRTHLTPTQ
jgi:DNA polymerase/3'-5' exonuclease PolX